jgi:DNA-binding transcriptional LysR family regulator
VLDLSQLRCFVAVSEELHFGRGAARLNMTQPPVSRQIRLLEHEVGVTLLERSSRTVQLTHAGRVFLPEAKRILEMTENAQRWAQRVGRGEAGKIRLGFTAGSAFAYLPMLLTRARGAFPDLAVQLEEMVSRDQVEALLNDELDVGLLRSPINPSLFEIARLGAEPFVLAVPSDSPLARRDEVALTDLEDANFLMYAPTTSGYFHDLVVTQLNAARVSPRFVRHVGQIPTMLVLVDAGFGCALVPRAASRLGFPNILYRPIATDPAEPVELYAAWRRENSNPALPGFIAACLQEQARPE